MIPGVPPKTCPENVPGKLWASVRQVSAWVGKALTTDFPRTVVQCCVGPGGSWNREVLDGFLGPISGPDGVELFQSCSLNSELCFKKPSFCRLDSPDFLLAKL